MNIIINIEKNKEMAIRKSGLLGADFFSGTNGKLTTLNIYSSFTSINIKDFISFAEELL